jgi:hypothetical protein
VRYQFISEIMVEGCIAYNLLVLVKSSSLDSICMHTCVGYIADDDFIFLVNQRHSFHLGHFYSLHRLYYLVKFVIPFLF